MIQKLRLIGCITACYLLTLGMLGYSLQHTQFFGTPVQADAHVTVTPPAPKKPSFTYISGKPVRIVIFDYGIDLTVDEGHYNPTNNSWTLSDTNAQFAVISSLANNSSGNTFIYGHGTDPVFGKIGTTTPQPGTIAEVYTDTGYVFTYTFREAHNLTPSDTQIFKDMTSGASRLTLQTCTGMFSEWRTMFTFDFQKVERQ